MSINSSLVKLADKIDADGKSTISPEYKNPNNSIEKSIERIADNYSSSGGGGGGTGGGSLLIVVADEPMATPPEWAGEGMTAWETNVTYKQVHDALTTTVVGVSLPANETYFHTEVRSSAIVRLFDYGVYNGLYIVSCELYYSYTGNITMNDNFYFAANAENGELYFIGEEIQ